MATFEEQIHHRYEKDNVSDSNIDDYQHEEKSNPGINNHQINSVTELIFSEKKSNISYSNCTSKHLVTSNGKKSRLSEVCDKLYKRKIELNATQLITRDNLFACEICGKSFKHKSNLKEHSIVHRDEKPYMCNVCGKSFKRSNALNTHMVIHTKGRPFSCETCGKSFTQRGNLNAHKLIHDGMKPFSCDECGKAFRQMRDLNKHKLKHTDGKSFFCEICGKSFKDKTMLNKHKLVHNRGGICEYVETSSAMNGEQKQLHSESNACNQVGNINVDNHILNDEKCFICEECGKDFKYKSSLNGYRISHQQTEFVCDVCSKSLEHISTLNSCKVIHADKKPFICDACGKAFSQLGI